MKILLAIDDSKYSNAAAEMMISQSPPQNTEVRVLHVIEPPSHLIGMEMVQYDAEFEYLWKALREQAMALVEKTVGKLRAAGYRVSPALAEGDATSHIIDVASEWNADLIVIGSHGRKGLDRFLMGSVAESVARHGMPTARWRLSGCLPDFKCIVRAV